MLKFAPGLEGDNPTEMLLAGGGAAGGEADELPPHPEKIKLNGMTRPPIAQTNVKDTFFMGSPRKGDALNANLLDYNLNKNASFVEFVGNRWAQR
jgi:hypothetical protein